MFGFGQRLRTEWQQMDKNGHLFSHSTIVELTIMLVSGLDFFFRGGHFAGLNRNFKNTKKIVAMDYSGLFCVRAQTSPSRTGHFVDS